MKKIVHKAIILRTIFIAGYMLPHIIKFPQNWFNAAVKNSTMRSRCYNCNLAIEQMPRLNKLERWSTLRRKDPERDCVMGYIHIENCSDPISALIQGVKYEVIKIRKWKNFIENFGWKDSLPKILVWVAAIFPVGMWNIRANHLAATWTRCCTHTIAADRLIMNWK